MFVCSCSSPVCLANGCQIAKGHMKPSPGYSPRQQPLVVPTPTTVEAPEQSPVLIMTKDDLRKIIREEISRALKKTDEEHQMNLFEDNLFGDDDYDGDSHT